MELKGKVKQIEELLKDQQATMVVEQEAQSLAAQIEEPDSRALMV